MTGKRPDLSQFSARRNSGEGNKVYQELLAVGELRSVPLNLVKRDDYQPRPYEEVMEGLEEFADELERDNFVLAQHPVFHEEDDGTYTVVVGERRTQAFRLKKRKEILAVCKKFTDEERKQIYILQYVENDGVLKKLLSPLADARWWKNYADKYHGGVIKEAARARGRAPADISNRLAILDAPESIQAFVVQHKLKDPATIAGLVRLHDRLGSAVVLQVITEFINGDIKGSFRRHIETLSKESKEPVVKALANTSSVKTQSATDVDHSNLNNPEQVKSSQSGNSNSKDDSATVKPVKVITPISEAIKLLKQAELIDGMIRTAGQGSPSQYNDLIANIDEAISKLTETKNSHLVGRTKVLSSND